MMFFEFKIHANLRDETILHVCDVIEWSKSDLHPTPESFHLDIAREFRAFSTGKVPSFTGHAVKPLPSGGGYKAYPASLGHMDATGRAASKGRGCE